MYHFSENLMQIFSCLVGATTLLYSFIFQVDSTTVEGKLFPRISAVGERLWSGPNKNWKNDYMEVEIRMVAHRQILVDRGIEADALQPEYCLLSEGSCELHKFEEESNGGSMATPSNGFNKLLMSLLLFKMLFFRI